MTMDTGTLGTPHASRLALKLVEKRFGPIILKVASALVRNGTQTLPELRFSSGLSPRVLKLCLLVLVQHDVVSSHVHEDPPNMRREVRREQRYVLEVGRVLHTQRLPRCMGYVRALLGPLAELVVRQVAENGRLTLPQIVGAVQSCPRWAEAAEKEEEEEASKSPRPACLGPPTSAIHAVFAALVRERLLERAPCCQLPAPPQDLPTGGRRRSAPKPGSEEDLQLARLAAQRALIAQAQDARFVLPEGLALGAAEEVPDDAGAAAEEARVGTGADSSAAKVPARKRAGKTSGGAAEESRKRARGEEDRRMNASLSPSPSPAPVDSAPAPLQLPSKPVWRLNCAEFDLRFLNASLGAFVGARSGRPAGFAAGALAALQSEEGRDRGCCAAEVAAFMSARGRMRERCEAAWAPVAGARGWDSEEEEDETGAESPGPKSPRGLAEQALPPELDALEFGRGLGEGAAGAVHAALEGLADEAACAADEEVPLLRVGGTARGEAGEDAELGAFLARSQRAKKDEEEDDENVGSASGRPPAPPPLPPPGTLYRVARPELLRALRLKHAEAALRRRFGPSGLRLWRALLLRGAAEQTALSEAVMLPKEEARGALYALLKAGFVSLQDVPRSADRAPSRTFYLWRAAPALAFARLGEAALSACSNLLARVRRELEAQPRLVELITAVARGEAPPGALNHQAAQVRRMQVHSRLLELGLLGADQALLLFVQ